RPDVLRANALEIALKDQRFLLNNKEIDILVLTHPDKDHCLELGSLFYPVGLDSEGKLFKPATQIKRAYYSEKFGTYGQHGVTWTLWNNKHAKEIYSVTINQDQSRYGRVTNFGSSKTDLSYENITVSAPNKAEILEKSRVAATRDFVKILDGTASGGAECAVYLLASNVVVYDDLNDTEGSDSTNRGSIVTMIVYGDKKFLFMGDSTFTTERFLIETYGDLIKDVELVHVPHHGSYRTSSSFPGHPEPPNIAVNFVGHVNPRYAVITAAYDSGAALGLPRYEIIDRYHQGGRLLKKPQGSTKEEKEELEATLITWCYEKQTNTEVLKKDKYGKALKVLITKEKKWHSYSTPKHLWCTGSHGAIDFDYEHKGSGVVDRV
ncbi:MAG TPA: hypothetical protein VJ865_12990, partial [Gemmatimonadaceae bacterium]|nr:hypothetical protein [Gemmatimonadaceae bacterium]